MRLGLMLAFFLAVASGAEAHVFNTTVSANYHSADVQIVSTTAPMDTGWFIERTGGRTVWGGDARIGHMPHGVHGNGLYAHATFVIRTTQATNGAYTVNINAGQVHVTSWYPNPNQDTSQQCHIFEDGTCNCAGPYWNICGADHASATIRAGFRAAALASRFAATQALRNQGVTVTDNP